MSKSSQTALAADSAASQNADDLRALFDEAKRLLQAGHAEQALPPLRDILSRCPNHPDALNFLSVAFGQLNMVDQAEQFSRQAIALRPKDPGFHLNLANRLKEQGRIDDALLAYEQALAVDPGHLPALKNLLRCLVADERWKEVRQAVDRLLPHVASDAELLVECAEACIGASDKRQALALYRQAVDIEPDRRSWLLQLARLAIVQNQIELARTIGERVIEQGEHAEMRAMLASIMHRVSRFDAMAEHLDAIPDGCDQAANAANLRGMMLFSQCRIREGLAEMARTKTLAPEAFPLQATRLMYMNYDPDLSAAALRDAHFAVGRHFAQSLPLLDQDGLALPHDPDRRLRIGFVSPDFRAHSVAYFTQAYFNAFDRDRFDVVAYAHVAKEDMVSQALREQVTGWRNVFNLSDQALAAQIRSDGIDILIDLAGYTRDTRLLAFTARPAPIQMTYIGYPNTTGLPAIDYRITDGITDPDGVDEDYSETLIRLGGCFLCYAIPNHAPPIEPAPHQHRGHVTFGSFNNFSKINPAVIATWADVLHAVPGSRLLCKSTSSADPTAQATIREGMQTHGINPERVSFCAFRQTPESHLGVYNDIDIALDTFPYNGTTTTCEALWMGVPVVALLGDRHASRVGASLLSAIGFPAGIASTRDEYVLTARLLAENPGLLKTMRHSLRNSLMKSPLCNSQGHASAMEQAFRAVWQIWCDQRSGDQTRRVP
ncbi:MAG: tetratricopeptide repeat protein [Alphaproteobacteria bacterium]